MKILLIGEYSNVHWTLAEALRELGHSVCVLSNGDYWKNYPRDISLVRSSGRFTGGIKYLCRLLTLLPRLRGYDVVQLINPMFLELKAEPLFSVYRYLKRHNRRLFLDAYGMDYFWVSSCIAVPPIFRYSDFRVGERAVTNDTVQAELKDWIDTPKSRLNRTIAEGCDGIAAGMYEYYACYHPLFPEKTAYIPFPIEIKGTEPVKRYDGGPVKFFIGIQKSRNEYKGTDIVYRALLRVKQLYPDRCEVRKAESVPFEEYKQLLQGSHVVLDQLYGYSPGMNALLAMGNGQVVVGGGEPECYSILHEEHLRPIVNVTPAEGEEGIFLRLEHLVLHPDELPRLQEESRAFVLKHHDPRKIALRYLDFWENGKYQPED